jgi:hypothetical protein
VQPEKDENVLIGPDGSLTLRAVREEDGGNYECVAKNEASKRESSVAVLSISELRHSILFSLCLHVVVHALECSLYYCHHNDSDDDVDDNRSMLMMMMTLMTIVAQ